MVHETFINVHVAVLIDSGSLCEEGSTRVIEIILEKRSFLL